LSKHKIVFGADHAGFALKQALIDSFKDSLDVGVFSEERVDYPDIADLAIAKMHETPGSVVILVCGSGQGMCMRANRYPDVRAALCFTAEQAQLAREHNDANVLCLAGRMQNPSEALAVVRVFLETPFSGGRHLPRVQKLGKPTADKSK
jgi:ribose 5-phosphate isomerase B